MESAFVINPLVAHYRHEDIQNVTATNVLLMYLGVSLTAALAVPRLGYGIPVCLLATLAIELWPHYGFSIFAWSVCLVGGITMWAAVTQDQSTR
jgi:hypothetical protein